VAIPASPQILTAPSLPSAVWLLLRFSQCVCRVPVACTAECDLLRTGREGVLSKRFRNHRPACPADRTLGYTAQSFPQRPGMGSSVCVPDHGVGETPGSSCSFCRHVGRGVPHLEAPGSHGPAPPVPRVWAPGSREDQASFCYTLLHSSFAGHGVPQDWGCGFSGRNTGRGSILCGKRRRGSFCMWTRGPLAEGTQEGQST